ncbi:MAG: hypothetical protein ICV66_06960 [Chitinophagaceae bacterium]|nr:hypothetical protein [Chitinophagaceae bacterium]
MKQVRYYVVAILFIMSFAFTSSCSQPTSKNPAQVLFEATTPCNEVLKKMLKIPSAAPCEMVKWMLTLYRDPKTSTSSTFHLSCEYGVPKQGTRGFTKGATIIELKGKWATGNGIEANSKATVCTLNADDASISLSFMQLDQNLLHLLDTEGHLMVGTAAWSYTLNRVDPVAVSSKKFLPDPKLQLHTTGDSTIVGIYDGRIPCKGLKQAFKDISGKGCQIIKCEIILYQEVETHTPAAFQLNAIYVGEGDSRHITTGKWTITQGKLDDSSAIVYQLQPMAGTLIQPLYLLKADDNILLFIDKDGSLMVGDSYCSYTLNRAKKKW